MDHNRCLKFGYRGFIDWPRQVGADEVKPETTAVTSPENVVSDSNLETSASLITRTEVAPTSTVVENTSSAAVSTDTTPTNVATQPTEATATA